MSSTPARRLSRRNPRQERSRITVAALLEAATRVFTEQGYARSTTNRIADAAGVSVGSLYQYFPDKLALLSALHERHLTVLMGAMTKACRTTAPAGLEPALRAVIKTAAAHHTERAVLVRAFVRHLPPSDKPPRASTMEFQAALRALLAANRGQLRLADHDLALFMLRSLGRSIMRSAAESRPRDLASGTMARELLASAMAFLTGERPALPSEKKDRKPVRPGPLRQRSVA
jgi:AcrR family transcriptional regulator